MYLSEKLYTWGQSRPRLSLTLCFVLWKLLLLAIALISPGPGYDTSTTILSEDLSRLEADATSNRILGRILSKLVRWDAIYYTQIADRGYVFEQEWAFGWGYTKLLFLLSQTLDDTKIAAMGVLVAHGSHFLSVLMLYHLTLKVWPKVPKGNPQISAFISGALHTISPAGMFLSAPYAESPFALLSFTGYYFYARSYEGRQRGQQAWNVIFLIISGLMFGLAASFRGNGLFNGLIFIYDAAEAALSVISMTKIAENVSRLFLVVSAGILMACIANWPQYLAYMDYCAREAYDSSVRPWCSSLLPSVYTWVQGHYWGVGFLKYWTLSNLPLFALATPMLCLLFYSSFWAWTLDISSQRLQRKVQKRSIGQDFPGRVDPPPTSYLSVAISTRLAIAQIVLATLALTTYHVQIITRLSSGYPLWYWWVASMILNDGRVDLFTWQLRPGKYIVRWMILYGMVQGGLFASFLPPA